MIKFDRQYIGAMIQAIEEDPYLGLEVADQIAVVYVLLNTESADGKFLESWGHVVGGPGHDHTELIYDAVSQLLSSLNSSHDQASVLVRLNSDFVAKGKSAD